MNKQDGIMAEPQESTRLLTWWTSFYLFAIPLVGLMVFQFGGISALCSWTMCMIGLILLGKLMEHQEKEVPALRISLLAFLFLSMAGLFFIYMHRSTYGSDFGWAFDDSFYFYNALQLAGGERPHGYTFFEPIIASMIKLISAIFGSTQLLDLLPLNWALGSSCVALSALLARAVTGHSCPTWLVLIALLFHVDYVDSLAHLYRDGLMLLFFLAAIYWAVKNQYLPALLAALAVGGVRGAHGLLTIFGITLLFLARGPFAARYPKSFTLGALFIPFLFVLMADRLPIAQVARSFLPGASQDKEEVSSNFGKWIEEREEFILQENKSLGDTTQSLHRIGPLGLVVKPVVQVFAPLRLSPPIFKFEVKHCFRKPFTATGFFDKHIFFWLNILMWPFVAPLLLLGLYQAMREGVFTRSLALFFLLLVMVVAYISFQPRHSLAFRVLVPTFIALACRLPRSHNEKYFLFITRLVVTTAILVLNTMALFQEVLS